MTTGVCGREIPISFFEPSRSIDADFVKLGLEDTGVLGQDEGMGRQLIDTEHSIHIN